MYRRLARTNLERGNFALAAGFAEDAIREAERAGSVDPDLFILAAECHLRAGAENANALSADYLELARRAKGGTAENRCLEDVPPEGPPATASSNTQTGQVDLGSVDQPIPKPREMPTFHKRKDRSTPQLSALQPPAASAPSRRTSSGDRASVSPNQPTFSYSRSDRLTERRSQAGHHWNKGLRLIEDHERSAEAFTQIGLAMEIFEDLQDAVWLAQTHNGLGYLLSKDPAKHEEAEAHFRKAIELDPTFARFYNNLALLLSKDSARQEEAVTLYRKAIKLDGANADAHNGLGNVFSNEPAKNEEAERHYRKAIELDSASAIYYTNLSNLFSEDPARHRECEALYRKAIELDSAYLGSHHGLGTLLSKDPARHDESETHFRKAIELNSTDAYPHNGLAILLSKDPARHDEAEAHYRKAIELDSTLAHPHNGLGRLLLNDPARNYEAETHFRKAIELSYANVPLYLFNLGHLLLQKGPAAEQGASPSTPEECFVRGFLLSSTQECNDASLGHVLTALKYLGSPLLTLRILDILEFPNSEIEGWERMQSLVKQHRQPAEWARAALSMLGTANYLERSILLHRFGDTQLAYREMYDEWRRSRTCPIRAAVALALARPLLETRKAESILDSIRPRCLEIVDGAMATAEELLFASLILRDDGNEEAALKCVRRCMGTACQHPANFILWSIAESRGNEPLSEQAAQRILEDDQERGVGDLPALLVPITLGDIVKNWPRSRDWLRQTWIQELLEETLVDFIAAMRESGKMAENPLCRSLPSDIDAWSARRDLLPTLSSDPEQEILRIADEEGVRPLLASVPHGEGDKLIGRLSDQIRAANLAEAATRDDWFKVLRFLSHRGRIDPNRAATRELVIYILGKHLFDVSQVRRSRGTKIAIASAGSLASALSAIEPSVANIGLGAIATLACQHLQDCIKENMARFDTFPEFRGKLPELMKTPSFRKALGKTSPSPETGGYSPSADG